MRQFLTLCVGVLSIANAYSTKKRDSTLEIYRKGNFVVSEEQQATENAENFCEEVGENGIFEDPENCSSVFFCGGDGKRYITDSCRHRSGCPGSFIIKECMRTSYIAKKELSFIPASSNAPIHIACQKLMSVTNHVQNQDVRIGTKKIIISTVVSHTEDHMTFNDLIRPHALYI